MRHQPAKAGEKNKIPFNKNLSFARTVYVRRAVIFFGCVGTIGILKFATSKFPGPSGNPFFSAASRSNMIPLNKDLAHGVNTFGTTLFSKLEDDNKADARFLSPWGIAHALAMLLEGAEPGSASYQQLQQVVYGLKDNSADASSLSTALKQLTDAIVESSNGDSLTVSDANSAWVGQGTELLAPYKDALASLFNADARQLTSAAEVNSWVAKATHDKIQTIIDDGVVRSAALVLVNAIYFKGLWEAPFSKMDTMRMPFHLRDGSTMDAPHMYTHLKEGTAIQGAKLSAAMGAGQPEVPCIAVKMAYQGGAYSAVLAMPAPPLQDTPEGQTREKLTLEGGIDYTDALAACRAEVTRRLAGNGNGGIPWMSIGHPQMAAAKVYLPRFEVEFGTSLGDVLKEAGLTAPFSAGDFTRMTAAGDLEVSDVVHKVYVKADEKGTEAAAATAVVMVRMAIMNPPPELFVRFDRPFVFSIVHEPSGLALFTGEVYKPEKWEG